MGTGKAAWQTAGLRSARRSQERATEKAGCLGLELQLQAPCTQNATPQKRWVRELLTKVCLLLVGAPALAGPTHGHPSTHPCTRVHVLVPSRALGDLVFSLSALVPKAGSLVESGAGPAATRQSPAISTPTGFRYA